MGVSILLAALMAIAAPEPSAAKVDAAVRAGLRESGANGIAVAVTDNGRITFQRSYGLRNGKGEPLTEDTVMYGASLTKTVFATLVVQLAAEGKLALDEPVAAMLPKPLPAYGNLDAYGNWGDLAGDPRWQRITPRHILNHATGFSNFHWDEPDGRLRIHFEPGSRYGYSGEAIMLLQFGIEQGLGLKVGDELQRRLFAPLGMTRTSLMWRQDFAGNLADGWRQDGSIEPHDERSRVRAAGSMDTTIADMARFTAFLHRLPQLGELTRPTLPITSRAQFPSLQPEAAPAARWPGLAAALGVVTFTGPQGAGFFKGGHNDSTGNMLVCVDRARRCVVILANDVRAEKAFPAIVRATLGDTGLPWQWEYPWLQSKAAAPRR
jgi:CubicO group peptidase (beta-lactamase class C family)